MKTSNNKTTGIDFESKPRAIIDGSNAIVIARDITKAVLNVRGSGVELTGFVIFGAPDDRGKVKNLMIELGYGRVIRDVVGLLLKLFSRAK